MESTRIQHNQPQPDPNLKPPGDEPELDLYTIPLSSGWFAWDSIHDTERTALREFFDGSSFTRTPKIYKEYRDFIISKCREDPSRRLTFTEVRKSLVGDVCLLRKVFNFLEKWGLINFNAAPSVADDATAVEEGLKVKVEEGPPMGIRVVATPNSAKPMAALQAVPSEVGGGDGVENGFKLPPLASYSDVFGKLGKEKGLVCGSCKEKCDSKYFECRKEQNYIICLKCYENGAYGEDKSAEDFKMNDSTEHTGKHRPVWTEAETLLLLESVLKHGDDWELVAQYVQTKTKLECISRLIELPFGELMLGSLGKFPSKSVANGENNDGTVHKDSSETRESTMIEGTQDEPIIEQEENGGIGSAEPPHEKQRTDSSDPAEEPPLKEQRTDSSDPAEEPPLKEQRTDSSDPAEESPLKKQRTDSSDPGRSLMEQVAHISTVVGPHVRAAAADAVVSNLCNGNPFMTEIFYSEDNTIVNDTRSASLNMELERVSQSEDSEMKDVPSSSEVEKTSVASNSIPLALRMRAAVATALGAAAAHAKLLADQEEREIEYLMSLVLETQLKKLHTKIKLVEELKHIMEKEHELLETLKESLISERINILQRIFNAGIPRWKDPTSIKPQPGALQQ